MQLRIRITHPRRTPVPLAPREAAPSSPFTAAPAEPARSIRSRLGLSAPSRVALGILLSRITGLARETVFAHYFGASGAADAFRAAVRIPNMLNNLFGEGVLSASFVTVFAKLRAGEDDEQAQDVAEAVFGILSVACAVLVLLGILCAPLLVHVIATGFRAEKRELTIRIVRILFPGTGMLVMSAWCLGVLNSYRRFLLSYTAPVVMNAAMIATLLVFSGRSQDRLAIDLSFGFVLGSVLQFAVQVPHVLRLLPAFRPRLTTHSEHVRTVLRNFGTIFLSRGVVQLSAVIDSIIASLLPEGAVASLGYAQVISLLPISLFSMSVSAAELPTLSSAVGDSEEDAAFLRDRIVSGLRRIAFFVVPSAAALLLLGDVLAAALFQGGAFKHGLAVYVWGILAGSAVGLLASALGRLYSSGFYALLDTATPLRFALIRVVLTITLGFLFALPVPRWLGLDPKWGVAGLTASAGVAGWVEFTLLRRGLSRKIGRVSIPSAFVARLWTTALVAGLSCFLIKVLLGTAHPRALAVVVIPVFGILYFAGTAYLGIEESTSTIRSLRNRLAVSR